MKNFKKIVFVGDGGVGKTFSIKKFINKDFNEETNTTPGIKIDTFYKDNETFVIWDFGGQEIMRSVHNAFLTDDTCFVIVCSNRWGTDCSKSIIRWIKRITTYTESAQIVLAMNNWNGIDCWNVDFQSIKDKYKNVKKVLFYNAKKDVCELGNLITKLAKPVCENFDVEKTQWFLNGLYTLINNGKEFTQNSNGIISRENIFYVLNNAKNCICQGQVYQPKDVEQLLHFIEHKQATSITDELVFMPVLCANETPKEILHNNSVEGTRFEMQFNFLSETILHRLACFFSSSRVTLFDKCWLKGVTLEIDGCTVVCDGGNYNESIVVNVYGNNRQAVATEIHFHLKKIEREEFAWRKKECQTLIYSKDKKAKFPVSSLYKAMALGESVVPYTEHGGYDLYNIQETLDEWVDRKRLEEILSTYYRQSKTV